MVRQTAPLASTGKTMMRKAILLSTAALLFIPLTAAAQEQPPLRTAVDGTFAPHAMPSLAGGYEGFNIDLANEIGKRLKRRIVIDAAQFSGLVPALQAGTYDFLSAPTTVTKERAENMLFTEGYLNTDFQFLIKKGGPKIEKLEDLKSKTVSVNKGSAYDQWARDLEGRIGWKVESFGTQTDAVQAVLAGRADANVAGNTVVAWAVKNNPQLELSYLHSTGLVWAAPLRKDSAELRRTIENAIECMKLDGTIAKMHEKWFGTKPQPGSAAVTVFPGYGVPGMTGYDPTEHTPACN
jgi:polar amino acid transport system substrate-binding protein